MILSRISYISSANLVHVMYCGPRSHRNSSYVSMTRKQARVYHGDAILKVSQKLVLYFIFYFKQYQLHARKNVT
jgi:hypothetical protein